MKIVESFTEEIMLWTTRHFRVCFKIPIIIIYFGQHTKIDELERLSTFVRINPDSLNHISHVMSDVENVFENKEKKIIVILCIHGRSQRFPVACICNRRNVCIQICVYNLKTYVEVGKYAYNHNSYRNDSKYKNIIVAKGIHIQYAMSWQMSIWIYQYYRRRNTKCYQQC